MQVFVSFLFPTDFLKTKLDKKIPTTGARSNDRDLAPSESADTRSIEYSPCNMPHVQSVEFSSYHYVAGGRSTCNVKRADKKQRAYPEVATLPFSRSNNSHLAFSKPLWPTDFCLASLTVSHWFGSEICVLILRQKCR